MLSVGHSLTACAAPLTDALCLSKWMGAYALDQAIDRRLITVESQLAHYERLAEEVSDVLAAQAKAIEALTGEVRRLRHRLGEIEGGWGPSAADDKPPPHY